LGDYIWLQAMFIVMALVFALVGWFSRWQLRKATNIDLIQA
jgi:hypothetical protein